METLHLAACDIGGSGGKLFKAEYGDGLLSLSTVHRFDNAPLALGDGLYWNILAIYNAVLKGLMGLGGERIDSFAVDAFANDFILLDQRGQLLEMPHTYRDARTTGMVERMDAFWPSETLYARTGIQRNRMNTLYQLLSLTLEHPEILDATAKMLFIPDAIHYFLTGHAVTEYTLASVSQTCAIHEKNWDTELLERIGFPTRLLTPIVPSGAFVGHMNPNIAAALNMPSIPIRTTAGHDTASAIVGVPADGGPFAYISSGTWSVVGMETPEPVMNEVASRFSLANEGGVCGTIRLLKNVNGLWLIQECRRQWAAEGQPLSYSEISSSAAAAPAFGPIIDPDLDCFTTPGRIAAMVLEHANAHGAQLPDAVGSIARCIFESLAMKYRYTLDILEKAVGYTVDRLHIVGGGSNNDLLNQLTADYTGKTIIAGPEEATAIGNICTQMLGMGALKSLAEARDVVRRSCRTRIFEPRTTPAHESHYQRFLAEAALPLPPK